MEQFTASWEDYSQEAFLLRKNPRRSHKIEIVKLVAQLKANASCTQFPTDVKKLAEAVGIVTVRDVPLAMRGCLLREPSGFVVEINSQLLPLDRRFVIAHEVTHLLIELEQLLQSSQRFERNSGKHTLGYNHIEELCDFGAREILLPLNSVRAELRREVPNLVLVIRISQETESSIGVTIDQICEPIMLWECTFLLWTQKSNGFALSKIAPKTSLDVGLVDETHSLVRKAFLTSEVLSGPETLDLATRVDTFPAEAVRVDDHSVLQMIHYLL